MTHQFDGTQLSRSTVVASTTRTPSCTSSSTSSFLAVSSLELVNDYHHLEPSIHHARSRWFALSRDVSLSVSAASLRTVIGCSPTSTSKRTAVYVHAVHRQPTRDQSIAGNVWT